MWKVLTEWFWRFTRSLSFKLSFYAGLILFLAVVAFAYRSISTQEDILIREKVQAALNYSEIIKAAIWNGMMTKDREVIREIVQTIGSQDSFKEINIYDGKGVRHYTSLNGSHPGDKVVKASPDNPLLNNIETDTSLRYRMTDDGAYLNVVNPLRNTTSCATAECHAHPSEILVLGALELKMPLQNVRSRIRESAKETLIFAFLLFLLISTIVGLAVIFGVLPPITRLQDNARKMARGQYTPQPEGIKIRGTDEISELTRVFDDMSRQINERTKQLDESRKMFKDLFSRVPCYLTVIDKNFKIVRVNQAFEDEFGHQVGKPCYQGFKSMEAKCSNCGVEKTFQDGIARRGEEVWNLGGDRKAYVVVHTAPIFDEKGNVVEVMEMALDVTRVERLQIELKRKEEQFKSLFENVPCYLTVIDDTYRIAFYNKVFAQDFGADSWGRKCYEIYKGRDKACGNCPVAKTFEDGRSHSSEEIWNRDGKDIHVVLHTSPVADEDGRIVAVMEMCTNVTELKLLQSELALLGETIAGMSHSVKNILAGLEGGVYVVDSGLKRGKEDRVRSGWEMVKRNVAKVSDLVKDILYASKEREPEYKQCDPATVMTEVAQLYEDKLSEKGIELIRDFPEQLGPAVIDPKGIHSAVSNLVSNAMAACVSAGAGVDEDRHIRLSAHVRDSRLVVEVSDDGCGMPDEVKENLFKKFYSTKGAKGTGLGLVVTRKIIEEHGGAIRVASRMGEGTCFSFDIPIDGNGKVQEEKAAAQPSA